MNKWVRGFLYFIAGIITLVLVVFLLIQTDWGKNVIRKKVQSYVSKKTGTEFTIGSIDYSLPRWVELKGVLMRDRTKDTLLYGKLIKADVAMLQILKGKYEINKILLEDVYVNLTQHDTDSVFNYQFIIDAFASKSETTTAADTSTIDLSLNRLTLKNTRFNMLDDRTGNYTRMSVKDLNLELKNLDVNKLNFDVDKLFADELRLQILINKPPIDSIVIKTSPYASLPTVVADSVLFKNSFISFIDEVQDLKSINTLGLLQLTQITNAANPNIFRGKYINLSNSKILFDHVIKAKAATASIKVQGIADSLPAPNNLAFIIDEINLNNNNITYNNNAVPAKSSGLDYSHLAISDLNLRATGNHFQEGKIQSVIEGFSLKDKSGFQLDTLKGIVRLDSGNIYIKDLLVKTPTSTIRASATVYPLSFSNSTGGNPQGYPDNNIILTNTIISKKDLDLLAEGLTRKYRKQMAVLGNLLVNTNITGNAKRMFISNLSVRTLSGAPFALQLSGTANNVTDVKTLSYNLNIKNLTASRALINPFLNTSTQPINLPPVISVGGLLAGNMNRLQTNLKMTSAFGSAVTKANLINFQDPQRMQYDIAVNATNLETGKWIYKDSLLGKLTGTVTAKGFNGFDIKRNNIRTTANISSFRFDQNIYNNIKLNAVIIKGIADYVASINDELVNLNMKGNADIRSQYPAIRASLNIKNADLFALGFATDSLQLRTLADVELTNSSPQNLDASFRLDSLFVNTAGKQIFADSVLLLAFVRNDSTVINLTSSLADVNMASSLNYQQLPALLTEVQGYYLTANNRPVPKAPAGGLIATFAIKPNEIYASLIKGFSFVNVGGDLMITNENRDSVVRGKISATELQIGTNKVTNMDARISGTSDSLLMLVNADTVRSGNLLLYDVLLNAGFADRNLSASLLTKDQQKREQFGLGLFASQNVGTGGYDIRLGEALKLNYENWTVNPRNLIRTSTSGFNVSDFDVNSRQQRIALSSTTPAFNAPLKISIDDFQLTTITAAFNQDSMLVSGLLNADFVASNFEQPIPTLDGNLKIDSIKYQQTPVGNLMLNANSNGITARVNGKLDGYGNNVDLAGSYNANNIDVKINLNPLTLLSVQPFTQGNLARSQGTISGPIDINGAVTDPRWNGELTFNDVQTTVTQFGTFMKIDDQKISLQYPTISFNNFNVLDSTNNSLKINGAITQNNQKEFISDLTLTARNFNIINNSSLENNMLYGKAIVEIDAGITGSLTSPVFGGNVTVKNGTEVTYVKQTLPASLRERDELVEFVDMDTISNLLTKKTYQEILREQKTATASTFQYNLNLEVEPEAKFNIIIDPATRDELRVRGSGNLNIGSMPNGDVSVAGTYTLKGGSYQLNYGPVKRRFELLDGSTVRLSGDPMNAIADITAAYEISTAPLDLVGNEIGGAAAAENAQYRRKVPFQVLLMIKGTAARPELSFDIRVKQDAKGIPYELTNTVENKLQQLRTDASAMNKQVFALLALNRFVGDQSSDFFGGGGAGGVNATELLANESVSSFLNAAVEQIAGDLITGVDLDVNLKSVDDDPAAKRTDLNVALGKTFLNDRLNVSVGKNFTVDGSDPQAKTGAGGNSSQFMPDINTTYKISRDGRYMLRAYRRNQYEAVMDGYFIETGVAFSFTMDYNKFKELFRRKANK